jgi:hypothetical protein
MMPKKELAFKVISFGIRFFLSGYLTFLIMNLTAMLLHFDIAPDSLNVVHRTVVYLVLAIPFLTCFFLSVLVFSSKERLVVTRIEKEKKMAALHLFGTNFSVVCKIVSYLSVSNAQGISSYLDIVIGSKSVVQMIGMNMLVLNFTDKKRKIVTALSLIIYILLYLLGYGVLSLILN